VQFFQLLAISQFSPGSVRFLTIPNLVCTIPNIQTRSS